ncbi:hypothetical protein FVE85_1904 [Porphyridium purpureum]|uniref:Uncharacterized protein n=1 Tax=Porphyridium purpureum TaxID=35688 RepID=A0A5J4YW38_PORPP|nr:hypothetical protein FVE85_1904 [Porphyridium purpureum]|eukprot:POR1966..scf209_3
MIEDGQDGNGSPPPPPPPPQQPPGEDGKDAKPRFTPKVPPKKKRSSAARPAGSVGPVSLQAQAEQRRLEAEKRASQDAAKEKRRLELKQSRISSNAASSSGKVAFHPQRPGGGPARVSGKGGSSTGAFASSSSNGAGGCPRSAAEMASQTGMFSEYAIVKDEAMTIQDTGFAHAKAEPELAGSESAAPRFGTAVRPGTSSRFADEEYEEEPEDRLIPRGTFEDREDDVALDSQKLRPWEYDERGILAPLEISIQKESELLDGPSDDTKASLETTKCSECEFPLGSTAHALLHSISAEDETKQNHLVPWMMLQIPGTLHVKVSSNFRTRQCSGPDAPMDATGEMGSIRAKEEPGLVDTGGTAFTGDLSGSQLPSDLRDFPSMLNFARLDIRRSGKVELVFCVDDTTEADASTRLTVQDLGPSLKTHHLVHLDFEGKTLAPLGRLTHGLYATPDN